MSEQAATWSSLSLESEELSNVMDSTAEVVSAIGTTIGEIADLLRAITSVLQFGLDFIENFLKTILQTLIDTIGDLLNSGLSACFHNNLKLKRDWKVSDWTQDAVPPFTGNGLQGWLYEVAVGSKSLNNPVAPRPQNDQPVAALILTKGVNIELLDSLSTSIEAISAVTGLGGNTHLMNTLKKATDGVSDTEKWKGLLDTDKGKSYFRMGAPEGAEQDQGAPPKSFYEEMGNRLDDLVENSEKAFNADENGIPLFLRGSPKAVPAWVSVRASDFLGDGISQFLNQLQQLLDLFNKKRSNPFLELIKAISNYLDRLEEAIQSIATTISLVDDLINTLATIDLCVIPLDAANHSTGIEGAIARALKAEGCPDYGPNGIVIGTMVMFQGADLTIYEDIERFFKFLNFDFSAIIEDYKNKFEEAFDKAATNITDAWAGTSLINKDPVFNGADSLSLGEYLYSFTVVQGNTTVATLSATSPNDPPSSITLTITGGTDQFHSPVSIGVTSTEENFDPYDSNGPVFSLNSSSGELTFVRAPDYNKPTSSEIPNIYQIVITADDGVDQTIARVTVNVVES